WGSNGNMIGTYGGIKGDLDDDFDIDADDMVILRKVILEYEEVSGVSAEIADFNSDSAVDVRDYQKMKNDIG
ncbi:MAG: hypothetical protein IKZ47_03280, partial [Clostridia bacterium]|nr:hypothetical protein [Clostridia bacterium]